MLIESAIFLPFCLAEKTLHVPTDDDFLKMYLRPCKYYSKSAYDRVSNIRGEPGFVAENSEFFRTPSYVLCSSHLTLSEQNRSSPAISLVSAAFSDNIIGLLELCQFRRFSSILVYLLFSRIFPVQRTISSDLLFTDNASYFGLR